MVITHYNASSRPKAQCNLLYQTIFLCVCARARALATCICLQIGDSNNRRRRRRHHRQLTEICDLLIPLLFNTHFFVLLLLIFKSIRINLSHLLFSSPISLLALLPLLPLLLLLCHCSCACSHRLVEINSIFSFKFLWYFVDTRTNTLSKTLNVTKDESNSLSKHVCTRCVYNFLIYNLEFCCFLCIDSLCTILVCCHWLTKVYWFYVRIFIVLRFF